jgi:hypothetical protein
MLSELVKQSSFLPDSSLKRIDISLTLRRSFPPPQRWRMLQTETRWKEPAILQFSIFDPRNSKNKAFLNVLARLLRLQALRLAIHPCSIISCCVLRSLCSYMFILHLHNCCLVLSAVPLFHNYAKVFETPLLYSMIDTLVITCVMWKSFVCVHKPVGVVTNMLTCKPS